MLAIEQSREKDAERLSAEADRIRCERLGIDPDNYQSAIDCGKKWGEVWDVVAADIGYHKAWDAWNRAVERTAKIGKRIFKIKPTTKAGLLVRVRVIETHDEIFDVEPLEKLLEEIRGFAGGASALSS